MWCNKSFWGDWHTDEVWVHKGKIERVKKRKLSKSCSGEERCHKTGGMNGLRGELKGNIFQEGEVEGRGEGEELPNMQEKWLTHIGGKWHQLNSFNIHAGTCWNGFRFMIFFLIVLMKESVLCQNCIMERDGF